MASKRGKCYFWAYLVFYQMPSSCTLSKCVPGYSTASKCGKCHFWSYLVIYQTPSSCTSSAYLSTLWHQSVKSVIFGLILYFIICIIVIFWLIIKYLQFLFFSDKNCNWILSTLKPNIANKNSRFQHFFAFVMFNKIYQSIPGDIFWVQKQCALDHTCSGYR